MATKCWNLDRAEDAFTDALWEAASVPVITKKLEIIYKAILEVKDNILPELWEDAQNLISEAINDYPEVKLAAAGYKNVFNPDFNFQYWSNRMSELDGEETDESKINKRSRVRLEFFKEKFKGNNRSTAGRAMLYFQRDTKLKLMLTFMVDRENGFLVADTDITLNVKNFKQKLLNTVVDYLKSVGYRTSQLGEDLLIDDNDNILLYDEDGVFQDILGEDSPLRRAIHEKLDLDVSFDSNTLKNYYEDFRSGKEGWQEKKAFIDAYNAKLLLNDFDTITTMLLGTIVKPGGTNYDLLSNESYETKINRATRMWSNGLGDEVENIADIVSEVTQMLIQTSKRYTWKGEPMEDQYLSFLDFNYIVTKVKKLSREAKSKELVLDDTFFNEGGNSWDDISAETKRSIAALKLLKVELGYPNANPTLEDLLSFISDNPLRHLHSVFDLLCNTNILDNFHNITPSDKNLIWTVGKELFGTWPDTTDAEGNVVRSRSLYDLHNNSNNDRIFEIVTQIADSMFADDFLQFYEDQEGTLKLRFLQDYSVSQEKNQLLYRMKQSNGMYDPDRFQRYRSKYNVEVIKKQPTKIYLKGDRKKPWMVPNPNYDPSVKGSYRNYSVLAEFLDKVVIPITESFKIEYSGGTLTNFEKIDGKYKEAQRKGELSFYTEAIWKSDKFRDFIKDTIGIDFNTDVELVAAYEELFKNTDSRGRTRVNYTELLNDISNLCGAVAFNLTFNNEVVPTILGNSARERNKQNVSLLRDLQFQGQFLPRIDAETGMVEMLSDAKKDAYLSKLATAMAMTRGLLTSALVKTGEDTALASQQLSCLRASYAYQFLTQNKRLDSASRHLTIINNENGLFRGNVKNREYKSDYITKVNTSMSATEAFTASFLGGFVGAFINSEDSSTINRNGNAYIIPAVYSDKTTLELLALLLKAGSRYLKDANGNPKQYINMSDAELELEMKYEFGEMYDTIIKNINNENLHFAQILGINTDAIKLAVYPVEIYRNALTEISETLCDYDTLLNLYEKGLKLGSSELNTLNDLKANYPDSKTIVIKLRGTEEERKALEDRIKYLKLKTKEDPKNLAAFEELEQAQKALKKLDKAKKTLGGIRKNRTIELMHAMMTDYNRTHRRKPIEMCEHVHYLYDKDGMLVPNDTLIALWGRFKGDTQLNELLGITDLYPEGHKEASTAEGYFKYEKDLRMALELLTDGVEIFLRGALSKENLEELEYLRTNFPDWITPSGKMTIAKVFDLGEWKVVTDPKVIEKYAASPETRDLILIHPMLSKLNRISYLTALLYTSAVGGAHYVYKGGGANVLEEEANRWLASNKRNVCYASTVHKYQNKTLNGVPKIYQIAPIEDIKSVIYSIMGDLDSHKPIDGGMYVNPWFPILENNSLGGEAAGLDKKQFGTYYYEKYAAGGIIKTAGFAVTNQRQRRSDAYTALCENMTNRIWIKEYTNANGEDIEEFLDITRDYKGNDLNWVQDENGAGTYYQRETADGGLQRFKLARIEAIYSNGTDEITIEGDARDYIAQGYRPTNRYKIYEYPVTVDGEIDTTHPDIEAQLNTSGKDIKPILRLDGANENGEFLINTNWALYNNVFGGAWSLSKNQYGKLEPSENSIYQMVHALNNVGYTRTADNNDANFGNERYTTESIDKVKDLDDLWQPLKYSDISYAPNIGALKSTLMNVNPKEGMYERTYLNAMNIMTAQLGIQLDKEHHADESEVSMPTQIIQACANKGYTIHYSDKLYKSLSTLTEIAISDCMKGIMEIMPRNENKGTLLTEVANIIVDKLIHSQDDNAALMAVMDHLILKAKDGHKLIVDDVVGKVAWSDPGLYNKIYNDLASHLTNKAIKMKFPGTLAVICPTERVEQMHGNRRLDAYANPDLGYNNANGDFVRGITAQMGLEIEQERIRTTANPQLILDEDLNSNATAQDRENLASNLDTQHHYWIEWRYADGTEVLDENGNIFRESITIDTPNAYFKVKDWMSTGGKSGVIKIGDREISRKGMKVARVYENIMKGRELGAYNARFESLEKSDSGKAQRFSIFDVDSVRAMFDFNDIDVNFENACDLLEEEKFILPQKAYALDLIERLLKKKYPKSHDLIYDYAVKNKVDIITAVESVRAINNSVEKDFTNAVFKVCKVLTYKAMELDLFRISKDYNGERKLWVNDKYITVNPKTIKTQAYELIMPKVYQSRFGLEELDLVQDILADKLFFTKRAINKLKLQHVSDDCFHYELKNFNGEHVYIWDSRLGEPDPNIFMPKRFEKFETETGVWERQDTEGNFLHGLSSENDKIMLIGRLGYEIIVTDNPEYYLENMKYNIALFSNKTVDETTLLNLVTGLKDTKSKPAQKFVRSLADRRGNLRNFRNLRKRNDAINNLSLEPVVGELPEVTELVEQFIKEGAELHASFDKSLDIIAGRIPAQSLLSFMPQRVVAFDNNDINTAYVSTFQLFLQGSDLDIDAVTLLGSEFDENGKYVIWSSIADISSTERLEASQLIPFPTGVETEIKIVNTEDSFFKTYDDYIHDLFEYDTDITDFGPVPATGEDGFRILKLKDQTPERLELLAEFIEAINTAGLTIKGDTKSDGSWKPSEAFTKEWEGRRLLDENHWLETSNALKDLGFTTPEAAYSALLQIKSLIDKHNTYINTADLRTRERMTKNQCLWAMYQICSTPSNLVELMVGVDVSTAPIKDSETGAVAQSPYNGDDKQAAPGNYNTLLRSFLEGQIGKQCVGIGAVSIKVNSTMQYYMDKRLSTGTEEEKARLLFPKVDSWGRRVKGAKQSYNIGGKERKGMFNLYDKSSETADFKEVEVNGKTKMIRTAQENNEIIALLDSILTEDDITPNVAMSLAAMLSVAVDNAKDLALAKINAGPKMFGFYAYGISIGMDIRDLAKIINTPQGRAISKLCEGNVVNGQMGAFSALLAILKLEGKNLFHDLNLFNVTPIGTRTDGAGHSEDYNTTVLINNEPVHNANEVLTKLIEWYYTENISGDSPATSKNKNDLNFMPPFLKKDGKIDYSKTLDNMVFQLAYLGKLDECIATITSPLLNEHWAKLETDQDVGFKSLSNAEDFKASIWQLIEWCLNYGKLVNTYYQHGNNANGEHVYLAKDLKILSQGAEEMRVLGTILSSNKGVKSKTEQGTIFIKTIENAIIDRKKIMEIPASPKDHIDFVLFCTDEGYRLDAIKRYEEVKHSINILDVVATAPHFLSYLRTCSIPYAAFKMGSSKFRARDRYYDPVVSELKLTKSADKENAIRGIESAVNARMLNEWMANKLLQFLLPKGSKQFVGRTLEVIITKEDLYIPLVDPNGNGLATFKCYMEEVIIPKLQENPAYVHNSFVRGLTPFLLSKTGTHAAITAYTLDGNLMPQDESQTVLVLTYQADFSSMYDVAFPGGDTRLYNSLPSYADAFYIYSQYVFGGKKGQRSLMTLFDDGECSFAKDFREYEATVDAEKDFEFELIDLVKWCAPNGNSFNPASEYFYAASPNRFGKELQKKASNKKGSNDPDALQAAEAEQGIAKKMEQVEATSTDLAKQYYLYPTANELLMGDNAFLQGVNSRVLDYKKLTDIVLDEMNPEETFSIIPNTVSGDYAVVANGYLSPRSEKILNYISNNLGSAYINVYNAEEGAYSLGISADALLSLVEEAKHEVDKDC